VEEVTPVEYRVPEEAMQQEVPSQGEQEAGEPDVELPKCQDHQPSSFLKGKLRSIYSLWFTNIYFVSFMFDALSCKSCLKPLMHMYYSIFLDYPNISCYPVKSGIRIYMLSHA
jgi:hypothetical protein